MAMCYCNYEACLAYHEGETYHSRIERLIAAPKPKGHRDGMPTTCKACREELHTGLSCKQWRMQLELELEYALMKREIETNNTATRVA